MDASQSKLPWAAHTIDELKLSLDVFADKSQLVRTQGDGFVTFIHSHDPARIVVWAGAGQTLPKWRERLSSRGKVTLDAETTVQVCGAPAHEQVARVPKAPSATGLVTSGDGSVGHITQAFPATVHVAVGFSVAGKPVVMSWIIPADKRDAYAGDEARFFASVHCL